MKIQIVFLGLFLFGMSLHARLVRDIYLEKDIPDANVVAVVKIQTIETTAKNVQVGQFHLDELTLSGKVLVLMKGDCKAGDTLKFLHYKAATPEETMTINGFFSFQFQPEQNYMLVLKKNTEDILQLPDPEVRSIPEFSEEILALIPASKAKIPLEQVVDLLILSFLSEKEPPGYSLKSLCLLEDTRLFREHLKEALKVRIIRRLVQIKNTSKEWKDLSAVHFYLSQLGEYKYLDEAIAYVLDEKNQQSDRFNAVSCWFQNYPDMMELEAYRRIAVECKDEFVRKNAQDHMKKM